MTNQPSTNESNGRDIHGRFAKGNRGGPGNPHAKQVSLLRSALLKAVSPEDVQQVMSKLIELAKAGDVRAIKEILDRTLGKPLEADLLERIAELEKSVAQQEESYV